MTDPNMPRIDDGEILSLLGSGANPQATIRIAYRTMRAAEKQASAMERIADCLAVLAEKLSQPPAIQASPAPKGASVAATRASSAPVAPEKPAAMNLKSKADVGANVDAT